MKDDTENMTLVPDESLGKFYTATDLKALADQGIKRANERAQGYSMSTEWSTLPNDHTEFVVKCVREKGFAELLIKVEVSYAKAGGKAVRSLSVYDAAEKLLRDEVLDQLQLKTDGNPAAFISDRMLTEAELVDELIVPAIDAEIPSQKAS